MTSIAVKSAGSNVECYKAYCLPITDKDDLHMLVAHLPGFMDTAEANNRQMVVEIYYQNIPPENS
jgi:hypothetical protein